MAASSSPSSSCLILLSLLLVAAMAQETRPLVFEGFSTTDQDSFHREEASVFTSDRMLRLTNTSINVVGRAFYSHSIQMLNNSGTKQKASSFSTHFVFSIVPSTTSPGGFGLAFFLAPNMSMFQQAQAGHSLGIYSNSNDVSNSSIFAVEFDTVDGSDQGESDSAGNDVGINNGTKSDISLPAAYIGRDFKIYNFSLEKEAAVQAWIEYDGEKKVVNVTVAPFSETKPSTPLILNRPINLTTVMSENMYAGFSASTGEGSKTSSHYILGWSFAVNGLAPSLDLSKLPTPPPKVKDSNNSFSWVNVAVGVLSALTNLLLISLCSVTLYKRYANFESLEDWELDCPHRFRYKDLHIATKGFKESELIGVGGFGAVYKGVLPSTGTEVAVKKIVKGPIQGMREFAAEIESLGRLRHKNLINLQGWCKQKNDLLLIYDYIPNGSLDSVLFKQSLVLNWEQRFNIIKGIANGLLYLHEEWEQVVVHRDIKTSNILIDADLNARLGDFGLARLYDHGEASHTTIVVGTIGYIAPELTRTGKASTSSDVYAFGILLLEVVSGRRPIGTEQFFLVDWVVENHKLGQILEVVDPKLGLDYVEEEVELVLKLGLLCAQHNADLRPTMRQVMRYLNFDDQLPDIGDWRRQIDSDSERMRQGFLEILSIDSTSTSYNLTSNSSMNSKPAQSHR